MTRQEELLREFMERKSDREPTSEEYDIAFDENPRLKAMRKALEVANDMTAKVPDEWEKKEKILRVLREEESAILGWLDGKRVTWSEFSPDLPIELRTKTVQAPKESPADCTARLKSSGMVKEEIAGLLKHFYPDLIPSRIGRLVTHDPNITVESDTYRKRGVRLLERYEKRKKTTS
jgi:hypothetical protein